MQIRYSPQAVRDLDRIWDDIVRVSASYDTADQYVNQIREAVNDKKEYPESGQPLYYEDIFLGFWSVRYKAYRAFYRIHGKYMQIVRVLPIKSDYMRTLFNDNDEDSES